MNTLNFRTLDLNLLRVFDEVMAERSLTRAARNLSLTQPAVSNALRRLRETLGDELVRRGGQGMGRRRAHSRCGLRCAKRCANCRSRWRPARLRRLRPTTPSCWPWPTPPAPN